MKTYAVIASRHASERSRSVGLRENEDATVILVFLPKKQTAWRYLRPEQLIDLLRRLVERRLDLLCTKENALKSIVDRLEHIVVFGWRAKGQIAHSPIGGSLRYDICIGVALEVWIVQQILHGRQRKAGLHNWLLICLTRQEQRQRCSGVGVLGARRGTPGVGIHKRRLFAARRDR